jgi:hypothetical protein
MNNDKVSEKIKKIIDCIDYHKAKNRHFAFIENDAHKKRKLLAGADFINEINIELKNILISIDASQHTDISSHDI